MSDQTPPTSPPPGPPPGFPPAGPPPGFGPPPGPGAGQPRGNRTALLVVAGVVLLLLVAGGVVWAVTAGGGGEPRSVEEVADAAVEAAEDLDVDAGVDLLCEPPSGSDRDELEDLIEAARDESGTDDPDVDYEISDVEGDTEGSFRVTVTSDEEAFEGEEFAIDVTVETDGDRSCIADGDIVE